mmetsp:Transcript_21463/g.60960  ORF Transcript_21463/g.60960 Transcript_21463/m.60960 type:complete len:214 (-) Transcript_21463:217-858(-)
MPVWSAIGALVHHVFQQLQRLRHIREGLVDFHRIIDELIEIGHEIAVIVEDVAQTGESVCHRGHTDEIRRTLTFDKGLRQLRSGASKALAAVTDVFIRGGRKDPTQDQASSDAKNHDCADQLANETRRLLLLFCPAHPAALAARAAGVAAAPPSQKQENEQDQADRFRRDICGTIALHVLDCFRRDVITVFRLVQDFSQEPIFPPGSAVQCFP